MSALAACSRWMERTPPFSWLTQIFNWIARRLFEPWLSPILRPFERREARRRIASLLELRPAVASSPSTLAALDAAIAMWARRLAEIERP